MCDSVVTVTSSGVWLAKNSDREPGEAQAVEHLPRRSLRGGAPKRLRCTHIEIDDVEETFAVVLSRPFWMWGAEMGVNERGVAIGNEAVFTTEKLDKTGLTGMDLLRLALERASTAREAVDVVATLLRAHGQGGRMGYRNESFTYSSSFLIADPREAWVLETAGRRWAAERVTAGVRAISNALTIKHADLVDDGTPNDFAGWYDRGVMSALAGASSRAACTARLAGPSFDAMARALRDHAGHAPADGLIMSMPCAHASGLPTRTAGQTTGSMIAHLSPSSPSSSPSSSSSSSSSSSPSSRAWFTGTSSPCLSVFKPVVVDAGALDAGVAAALTGAQPVGRFDAETLWWRHERLHRDVLADWSRSVGVRAKADALEARVVGVGVADVVGAGRVREAWAEHRALVDEWRASVARATPGGKPPWPFARYWRKQSALDSVPA